MLFNAGLLALSTPHQSKILSSMIILLRGIFLVFSNDWRNVLFACRELSGSSCIIDLIYSAPDMVCLSMVDLSIVAFTDWLAYLNCLSSQHLGCNVFNCTSIGNHWLLWYKGIFTSSLVTALQNFQRRTKIGFQTENRSN